MLIEPFDSELDRLLARRAVDAVVRNAGDEHVLLRLRGALVSQFRVIFDVEYLFLLRINEERRAIFEPGRILDRRVKQQMIADRRADQIADHAHLARRRVTKLAARPPGGFVIGEFQLVSFAPRQHGHRRRTRIERGHLADNGFNARVARGDVNDVAARITRTAQANAIFVHHRFTHRPMNRVEPIGDELQRVNHFAHLHDYGGEFLRLPIGGFDRRSARQNQPRITLAPAAIIEGQHQIPSVRQITRIAAKARCRAAPTVRLNDCRELFACERFEREDLAVHPYAFTHDVDASVINVVRRFEAGGRGLLLRRRIWRAVSRRWLVLTGLRHDDGAERDGPRRASYAHGNGSIFEQDLPPWYADDSAG